MWEEDHPRAAGHWRREGKRGGSGFGERVDRWGRGRGGGRGGAMLASDGTYTSHLQTFGSPIAERNQ